MSTRSKQHVVTEFLSAENVTPAEIHHRLQAVYGEDTVNRTTVNHWAVKFRECEPGNANIDDQPRSGSGNSQRVYMTEFLEAGNTVNSARYIETLKNLRRRVCRVRGATSRILLLCVSARPYTARTMIEALETLKFEVLSHPPYSPDLAPSDFHFFPHLKRDLKGTHFNSDDEVTQAVTSWIKQRTPEFFTDGMCKLVLRWEKCIEQQGEYV
jgi:transposase